MDKLYRLAFREEGTRVVCYYALPDTMDNAIELSSIRLALLRKTPDLWNDWRDLMKKVMGNAMEQALGSRPTTWDETPAPEHERAGKG